MLGVSERLGYVVRVCVSSDEFVQVSERLGYVSRVSERLGYVACGRPFRFTRDGCLELFSIERRLVAIREK